MYIIPPKPEMIKASEVFDEPDVDATATKLLNLPEFVVESFEIADEPKQEIRFYCRLRFDYAICPRCSSVSEDIHQYKRRCVRLKFDSDRAISADQSL